MHLFAAALFLVLSVLLSLALSWFFRFTLLTVSFQGLRGQTDNIYPAYGRGGVYHENSMPYYDCSMAHCDRSMALGERSIHVWKNTLSDTFFRVPKD